MRFFFSFCAGIPVLLGSLALLRNHIRVFVNVVYVRGAVAVQVDHSHVLMEVVIVVVVVVVVFASES